MDDIRDFNKVLQLPPVRTRLSTYLNFGKAKNARWTATRQSRQQRSTLEPRKDEVNFDLLRQIAALHKKPHIDVGCFFDPSNRVPSLLDSFVTLSPDDRREACSTLKLKYPQRTLSKCGIQEHEATHRRGPMSMTSLPSPAGETVAGPAIKVRRRNSHILQKPESGEKLPHHQTRHMQLYDRIVKLFNSDMEEETDMFYSERIQKGMEPIDHQKDDYKKIQILFTHRRLELPRHVKSKFTKSTQTKFAMQSLQGKIIANS